MTNTTLKPCPFCGREADISDEGVGTEPERYWVYCVNPSCFVEGTAAYATEAEAIDAWNTRAERTCAMTHEGERLWKCDYCGSYYERADAYPYEYCPRCGAKVIGG